MRFETPVLMCHMQKHIGVSMYTSILGWVNARRHTCDAMSILLPRTAMPENCEKAAVAGMLMTFSGTHAHRVLFSFMRETMILPLPLSRPCWPPAQWLPSHRPSSHLSARSTCGRSVEMYLICSSSHNVLRTLIDDRSSAGQGVCVTHFPSHHNEFGCLGSQ